MPLRGELQSVDLAHVLQMLVLNQKAGTLEIVHEGARRPLWFTSAGILVPHEADLLGHRAVQSLVRRGILTGDQVKRARHNMSVLKKDLPETLVEMKCISEEDRIRAFRGMLEEDAYELFFLKDGSFEFRDELPDAAASYDPRLALSANGVIMEAARRIDEWEYIRTLVASEGDILDRVQPYDELTEEEKDGEGKAVYEAIDGVRNVAGIISVTHMPRFQVFRKLAILVDSGVVEAVPVEGLLERAGRCLEDGRAAAAIDLFERAFVLGVRDVDPLAGAGRAYESLERFAEAADRYLAAGRRAELNGDLDAALNLYRRIRQLVPTQVEARERLFGLRHLAESRFEPGVYDARSEGAELAEILFELDRSEELSLVLAGLIDLAADSPREVERVAELAARLGQVAFAIDAMTRAADLHSKKKSFASAERVLKAAQVLDPNRAELSERLRRLSENARTAKARRRSSVRAVVLAAGFVALFLGYERYSRAAMDEYSTCSIEDFMVTARFAEGRDFYERILRSYPLTIPFLLAFEKLRELDVAERNHREIERYRAEVEADDAEGRLRQARMFKEAALGARHTGDYQRARELLEKTLSLSGDDDPLDVRTAIETLEEYLSAARRLKSEAVFFRNAGRFAEAHARIAALTLDYPNAPESRDLLLPVQLTSDPPKARIFLDGAPLRIGTDRFQVVAETPFVVDLIPNREVEVRLELDGHVTAVRKIRASDRAEVMIPLPQRSARATILPADVAWPLVTNGAIVVAALRGGRLAALDANTLEPKWIRELDDLREVCAPPAIFDGVVAAPIGPDRIVLFDGNGHPAGSMPVPGRPVTRPARAGDRVAVGVAGGGLAVGHYGQGLERVDLPTELTAGPLALPDGRFAVGGKDGNVWLCRSDRTLNSISHGGYVVGGVSALSVDGTQLAFGDDGGGVFTFDLSRNELLSQSTALAEPVEEISLGRGTVVASGGRRVVAVEASTGRVTGSLEEETALRLAIGGGEVVAASTSDGRILVLSRLDLRRRELFSADSSITVRGALTGRNGLFAATGGKVVGIFCPSQP